jgi:hypothetical protein
MWETVFGFSRGSVSSRVFLTLATSLVVACFGIISAVPSTVYAAADATWKDDTIVYANDTYQSVDVSAASGLQNLPAGAQVYQFVPTSTNTTTAPKQAKLIYFDSGVVPKSAKEATYIEYTLNPPNTYSSPANEKTISVEPATTALSGANTDESWHDTGCTVKGIGWIVCPLMKGVAEGMDFIYGLVAKFLIVQPVSTSVDSPIYRVWVYARDIANVLFIIGFLVIIYQYLAGGGFNGYEIRKIVPRVIIAAILVNLSYVMCSVAVDASNIAGSSLNHLFEGVRDNVLTGSSNTNVNWVNITGWVIGGGSAAVAGGLVLNSSIAGAAGGLWFLLAPFLLGAALLVVVTFLILAARQALITILIIASPIAFAAFILPNTEKWFEKWRSVFVTMLVMFPAFAAVFGGAQLAGELIIRTANSIELVILGLGVQVAPLAITPLLLRLGGGVLNRFGGIVNNTQKGLLDRYKNYNGDRLAQHRDKHNAANAALRQSGGFGRYRIPGTNRSVPANLMRRRAAYDDSKRRFREGQQKLDQEKAENYWHAQTGRWGGDNHGTRDQRNRFGRRQDGYGNLDTYKRDNTLDHDQHEAHNEEHWQNLVQGDARRRGQLTDTRLTQGRAKITEEAMSAQDERTLQTAINTNAAYSGLRAQKVQTSVDSGVAEIHKSDVDSSGKLALSQTVDNNAGMQAMKIRTHENEKRAETLDNIVKKNAEQHWETISRTDGATQTLRLREAQASDLATKAEEQYKSLMENIIAKGSERDRSGNLIPDLAVANAGLAASIKGLRQDIQVEGEVQESAKMLQQENMVSRFKTEEALRTYAGGVAGQKGINKIYAKARSSYLKAMMERITESRDVIDEYTNDDLHKLYTTGVDRYGVEQDWEMRQAAMYEILLKKGNHWQVQKTRDWVSETQGYIYDDKDEDGNEMVDADGKPAYVYFEPERDPTDGTIVRDAKGRPKKARRLTAKEAEDRRDTQQVFMNAYGQTDHYLASMSGTDRGEYQQGQGILNMKDAIIRDIRDDKFNGERVVKTDNDEWQRLIQILRDVSKDPEKFNKKMPPEARQKLIKHINETQRNPTLNGRIKGRERGLMNAALAYLDDNDPRPPKVKETEYYTIYDDELKIDVRVPPNPDGSQPAGSKRVSITTLAPTVYNKDRWRDFDDGYGPDGTLRVNGAPKSP